MHGDGHSDGGPAYPHTHHDTNMYGEPLYEEWGGMSLRDWFAGQVISGIFLRDSVPTWERDYKVWAERAYKIADAMIEAR